MGENVLNNSWIDIATALENSFDYDEYVRVCIGKDIEPLPLSEYAQRLGILFVARERFKSGNAENDYQAFISEMMASRQSSQSSSGGGKGGCG